MQEKELKTSLKQRIFIGIIAVVLFFSTIAVYALIVVNHEVGNESSKKNDEQLAELQQQATEAQADLEKASEPYSDKYFKTMKSYRSRVKAYNAEKANSNGLKTKDLKKGTGKKLSSESVDYMAYYIGWCADETVFDTNLDDFDKPTRLATPLVGNSMMIEGWKYGLDGMKLGGVREITIPGELAYGETQEICGGTNSPLKFVVLAVKKDEKIDQLQTEIDNIKAQIYALSYGIEY